MRYLLLVLSVLLVGCADREVAEGWIYGKKAIPAKTWTEWHPAFRDEDTYWAFAKHYGVQREKYEQWFVCVAENKSGPTYFGDGACFRVSYGFWEKIEVGDYISSEKL